MTDDGIICWGSNKYKQLEAPNLRKIDLVKVSAGHDVACAITTQGITLQCCGNRSFGSIPNDMRGSTTDVSVGGIVCGIKSKANTAECFSFWAIEHSETTVLVINHPTLLASGLMFACSVDDQGVERWGDNEFGQTSVTTELVQ